MWKITYGTLWFEKSNQTKDLFEEITKFQTLRTDHRDVIPFL